MKTTKSISSAIYFLGLAGALLFTLLLAHEGAREVVRAVAAAGWWLVLISALHLLPFSLDSFEWWILFPKRDRLPLLAVGWARFLGESVSNLVPAAQVGGDLVRARLAVLKGASLPVATATVLVDITVSVCQRVRANFFHPFGAESAHSYDGTNPPDRAGDGGGAVGAGSRRRVLRRPAPRDVSAVRFPPLPMRS
jgi:hypothetical protein